MAMGCGSSQPAVEDAPAGSAEPDTAATAQADTVIGDTTYTVLALDRAGYQVPQRTYDLLHTALDLRVDLDQRRIDGSAMHRLTPLGEFLEVLRFDAAGLDIALVTLTHTAYGTDERRIDTLRFVHENGDLLAYPVEPLTQQDTADVRIIYGAKANGPSFPFGFVVPSAPGEREQSIQTWTLGHPEHSQRWFPTWDYPHELATYTVALTVPDSLKTFSIGRNVEQFRAGDGMRRDRWVLDEPQPAYLVSFAVGNFAEASDAFRRTDGTTVPLSYVTDSTYASHANLIFGETPRILKVLEDKAGLRYPWPNLKQATVRDFPAGGMEHTTNVFYTGSIQGDERAYRDIGMRVRTLLAHEIAHQWFGDLVVYDNWANTALTEGFATFLESVYLEEVFGLGVAQGHRISDRSAYLEEAASTRRPIIWYGYSDPVELYDAHSYPKAALVLHQLRQVMGEEAFWRGVQRYIRAHQRGTVTLSDFQRAMEAETGTSLRSYFEQWFLSPGHPELRLTHRYDENRNIYHLRVQQVQDTSRTELFDFEVDVEVNFFTLDPYEQRVRVNTQDTTFVFAASSPISFVRFNAGDWLLADITVKKPVDEWIAQVRRDDEMAGRYQAVDALGQQSVTKEVRDALAAAATNDPQPMIRVRATEGLARYGDQSYVAGVLKTIVLEDTVAAVRQAALASMERSSDAEALEAAYAVLNDPAASYRSVAAAVRIIAERDPENAMAAYQEVFELDTWQYTVEQALVEAMGVLGRDEGIPYLLLQMDNDKPEALVLEALEAAAPLVADKQGFRTEAVRRMQRLLDAESVAVRLRVVTLLEDLAGPSAVEPLEARRAVESSSRVRQAIDRALTQLQSGSQ